MKRTIATIFFAMLGIVALQAQTEKSFPQYTWIDANVGSRDGSRFGYEKASFTPILKSCRRLSTSDPCYEAGEYDDKVLLGRYKNGSMANHVHILYSPGPSADPTFYITDKGNRLIWEGSADELAISSSGIIYVSGNSNKMFNQRLKLKLANNKVAEVKQPFYYVGVKGKLLKPVKLYSQKNNKGSLIATLPAGYEIEVLLAEGDPPIGEGGYPELPSNYLARSAFGLVGWLKLGPADMTMHKPVVRGLGYMGD